MNLVFWWAQEKLWFCSLSGFFSLLRFILSKTRIFQFMSFISWEKIVYHTNVVIIKVENLFSMLLNFVMETMILISSLLIICYFLHYYAIFWNVQNFSRGMEEWMSLVKYLIGKYAHFIFYKLKWSCLFELLNMEKTYLLNENL